MKNNTASSKLDKALIREQFEAITGLELNALTLYQAMTQGLIEGNQLFRNVLRDAFSPVWLTCDLRKNDTWTVLSGAMAIFNSLLIVETKPDASKTPRGMMHVESTTDSGAEEIEATQGTNSDSPAVSEKPLEVWHLDDPGWRDARIMQMGEWHLHFRQVEWKFRRSIGNIPSVLKEYATLLLSETTDDAEDLLRHLHEEVVTYLANKLAEAVDDAWREATAVTLRLDSPVKEFEELIEECRQMMVSTALAV